MLGGVLVVSLVSQPHEPHLFGTAMRERVVIKWGGGLITDKNASHCRISGDPIASFVLSKVNQNIAS